MYRVRRIDHWRIPWFWCQTSEPNMLQEGLKTFFGAMMYKNPSYNDPSFFESHKRECL